MGIEPQKSELAAGMLGEVRETYERGQYLTAYRMAEALAPLRNWHGTAARVLAGRLAGNLGSQRLADLHFIRAHRTDPTHPEALWYFANHLATVHGPWRAWRFMQTHDLPADAPDENRSHWYSLKARILGSIRDFDTAEEWLARAESLGDHVWVSMERAALYMWEDRHADAEAVVQAALERRPWYRPAVQWLAHFLVQRERDDEAMDLLREACTRLESGAVWLQRHHLEIELQRYEDAAHSLDEFERHSPLLETILGQWLASRRADLAYWSGDWTTAREQAEKTVALATKHEQPLYVAFARALADAEEKPRPEKTKVELPVPFVRQHFQTCVPATLAAICRFWGHDVDHVATAEAITYRGTPHGKERRWAEQNGYVTREFTTTWDAAVALIDRGIPFTLTTTEVSTAHLQALIGYDVVRRTFLIRDPGERHRREFFTETFFKHYQSTGPRGMALVPRDRAELLQSLALPDEQLYDRLHRAETALEEHHRTEAAAEVQALEAEQPDHLITLTARRMLEMYDANTPGVLAAVEKLLVKFPEDLRLQLAKVNCLREMGRREDRLALLEQMAHAKTTDPTCWLQYAQELADDGRQRRLARRYLEKALRFHATLAANYSALGRIFWDQRQFDAALEVDRFALCLEDKDEFLARNYFQSARVLHRTEEALNVLRRRFERFGARTMLPARTLYFALVELEKVEEAVSILERALALRPQDGDLLVFVAESYLARGKFDEARSYLERARGLSQPMNWLRTSANLARQEGDLQRSRDLWLEVLQTEPLALDAHRNCALTLAEIGGPAAAIAHLRATCERFPHHFQLAQILLEWLRDEGAPAREAVVRRLIEIHPAEGWSRRECAIVLAEQGKFSEAREQLELASQLDPKNPSLWTTRFYVHSQTGELALAKADAQEAIRLSVDAEVAQQNLLSLCDTLEERRDALKFIEAELIRQVTFGQGLLFFRDLAVGTLEHDELLDALEKGLRARPDLWHAWAAVVRQLTFMERFDEALTLAQQAVERFPHLPTLLVDLAAVHRARQCDAEEIDALNRALAISPGFSLAQRTLAAAHERAGRLREARAVHDSAIARAPLMSINHLTLAEFVARHESKDAALAIVADTVRLDPGLMQAWDRYFEWSLAAKKFEDAIAFARQATRDRPWEARAWLYLALALAYRPIDPDPAVDRKNVAEILAAYDEALKRNPRLLEVYDRKATLLAEVSRTDEALAVCRPAVYGDRPPVSLLGRAAWILARQGNLPAAIKAMRDVLASDRNYRWGWTMLADWLQQTGAWNEYLEAAENLIRLNPGDPVGVCYRGEAKQRLGQRQEALDDFRRALRISPSYPLAGILLFEEHFAANELDAAAEALNHLARHAPSDEVTARELRLAVRRGEKETALQILRKLGRAEGENAGPLQSAVQVLEQAGYYADVEQVLRELAADGRAHPWSAVLLCERADVQQTDDLNKRLVLLDRALQRIVNKSRPLDLKAELLARAGQFDEALAVCNGPVSPDAKLPLQGRAAWIYYLQGNLKQAVKRMRKVLADNPIYFWGWTQLAVWAEQSGNSELHMECAAKLIELAPHDPTGYIERGQSLLAVGQHEDARAAFFQSLQIRPQNTPLGLDLIGKYLDVKDSKQATQVLDLIEPFLVPADAAAQRRLIEYLSLPVLQRVVRLVTFRGPSTKDLNRFGYGAEATVIGVLGAAFVIGCKVLFDVLRKP